jgi:hypothetical protein
LRISSIKFHSAAYFVSATGFVCDCHDKDPGSPRYRHFDSGFDSDSDDVHGLDVETDLVRFDPFPDPALVFVLVLDFGNLAHQLMLVEFDLLSLSMLLGGVDFPKLAAAGVLKT